MTNDDTDDTADLCPCTESEAAAALSLIVARVLAMDVDPLDIVIVRTERGDVTEWRVEHRPRREGGN